MYKYSPLGPPASPMGERLFLSTVLTSNSKIARGQAYGLHFYLSDLTPVIEERQSNLIDSFATHQIQERAIRTNKV